MAKVKLQARVPDGVALGDILGTDSVLHEISSTLAIYADSSSNDYVVCNGRGLDYNNGTLVGGTIHSLTLYDSDGRTYGKIDGLTLEISTSTSFSTVGGLINGALDGNDVITGSSGDDTIYSGVGRDVVKGRGGDDYIFHLSGPDVFTGGGGRDEFALADSGDRVTITDFDSKGPARRHDVITTAAEDYSIRRAGQDTVVTFSTGAVVRLLDIRPAELDAFDIVLM